jgi:hypothetical protein
MSEPLKHHNQPPLFKQYEPEANNFVSRELKFRNVNQRNPNYKLMPDGTYQLYAVDEEHREESLEVVSDLPNLFMPATFPSRVRHSVSGSGRASADLEAIGMTSSRSVDIGFELWAEILNVKTWSLTFSVTAKDGKSISGSATLKSGYRSGESKVMDSSCEPGHEEYEVNSEGLTNDEWDDYRSILKDNDLDYDPNEEGAEPPELPEIFKDKKGPHSTSYSYSETWLTKGPNHLRDGLETEDGDLPINKIRQTVSIGISIHPGLPSLVIDSSDSKRGVFVFPEVEISVGAYQGDPDFRMDYVTISTNNIIQVPVGEDESTNQSAIAYLNPVSDYIDYPTVVLQDASFCGSKLSFKPYPPVEDEEPEVAEQREDDATLMESLELILEPASYYGPNEWPESIG